MHRWLKRLLLALALVGSAVGLGAIAPVFMPRNTKVKHLTHKVSSGDLAVMVTENGAVESSNNKEIKCMVKGGSTVLWVKCGGGANR